MTETIILNPQKGCFLRMSSLNNLSSNPLRMALSEGQSVFDISELFLLDQAGEAVGNFVALFWTCTVQCADYLAAWSGSNDGWASHSVSVR